MLGHSPVAGLPISGVPDVAAGVPNTPPPGTSLFPHTVPRREFGYSQVFTNLLLTTLAVSGTTLRPPVITPRANVPVQQVAQAPNLLTGTLAPAVAAGAPFVQEDWPNPRVVRFIQPNDAPNLLTTTLAPVGVVQSPFAQEDWPNPATRPVAPTPQTRNLLTTTLAPAGAVQAPFSQEDWPNPTPTANRAAAQAQSPNLLTGTLAPAGVVQAPFAQDDWPNPQIPRRLNGGFEYSPIAHTLLLTPYAASDNLWPNPLIPPRALPFAVPNLLTGTLAPVAAPFAQSDWAVPSPRARAQDVAQAPNLALLAPPVIAPFAQDDWPNPRAAARAQPDQPANLLPLSSTPVGAPFAQTQWPNPVLPRFRPELAGFTQSTQIPFVSCFSGQQLGWLRAICYLRGLIPGVPANHSTTARTAGPVTQTLTGDDVLATLTTTASFGGDPTGSHLTAEEAQLLEMLARSFGLVAPITTDIGAGTITDGTLNQTIAESSGTTIVTRT